MGTEMVDVRGVLGELRGQPEEWQGLHPDTVLGHMHIQVSNLRAAMEFYHDVIGFDVMTQMGGSAGFVSAGGYHHHLGINTWGTAGAPPPPRGAIGLRYFTVVLPNLDALREVTERVRAANIALEETDEGLLVRDPSQNALILTSENVNALSTSEAVAVAR
jgi:catechol 2,3-dioxygenase